MYVNRLTQLVFAVFLLAFVAGEVSAQDDFFLPSNDAPASENSTAAATGSEPRIEGCKISLVDDIELPATEAGVLVHLGVKEGSAVRTEDVVARIDARQAEMEKRVAEYELNAAAKKAKADVPIRFAQAQAEKAQADLEELLATNEGVAKAVPEADIRQAEAELKAATLRIENAEHDQELAMLDAWVKKAQVDATDMAIDRRVVRAPFDGVVLEMFRQEKEWVNPGDPVLRLVRLDTLKVKGLIDVNQFSPAEVQGCEVTVDVPIGRGRTIQAPGRVVWIDPNLQRGLKGAVRAIVHAEIANRQENGYWLIHPNRTATMTIHLGTGAGRLGLGAGG